VYISICIPTYNSGEKLEKLLDSIKIQSFKGYEIVISDDSRNESVKSIIDQKYSDLNIKYYHNNQALGTPNNWNNAIAKASGDWIKLMHHDDWFCDEHSLQEFVDRTKRNTKAKLIFCAFNNIDIDSGIKSYKYCSSFDLWLLKSNYLNLYKNFIGNPSCTLVKKNSKPYEYDKRIKWLIDFDFYTSILKEDKHFEYIDKPLVAVGIHLDQVTKDVFMNPVVEIPESFLLFDKYGISILRNIFVYDFFWRMYRNLGIKSINQLESYLGKKCEYRAINKMIKTQNTVPEKILKIGLCSKFLMTIAYIRNKL
jgi:glycosyltransferase involved in cell wall biosynthesis